ncbi:MAG: hypothetical protein ACHREM_21145 [Polyangiales bacterium]
MDPRFDVVGWSDVAKLVEVQVAKQSAGCDTDSCMAEIGGALGAEYILAATLGQLGHSFVVSVRLVRVKDATVSRSTETVPANEDLLGDAVRHAVREVIPAAPSAPGVHRASYWLGVAGASAVTAGGLGLGAYSAVATRNMNYGDAATFRQTNTRAQGLTIGSNVVWGVAATSAVAGAIVWLIERRSSR